MGSATAPRPSYGCSTGSPGCGPTCGAPGILRRSCCARAARSNRVGHPGHPLGVLPAPTFRDDSALLAPGDTLVLYTDGVTDAGGGDGGLGEDGLAEVVAHSVGLPPGELLTRIELAVGERGSVRDDIALLAARVRG